MRDEKADLANSSLHANSERTGIAVDNSGI